ncbi:MAG: hypothetical protein Kow00108_09950 [Calditrichia bacterium]
MKKMLLFLILFSTALFSQDVFLDLKITVPDAESFYVGDLDFIQRNSNNFIFSLEVRNNGPDVQGSFNIRVIYQGLSGPVELVRAVTNSVTVPQGANWVISNVDLNRGYPLPGTEEELEIVDYSLNFDRLNFIEDYVLRTNKLPSGKYDFTVSFNTVDDVIPTNNTIIIRNPSYVQLSFPGNDISNPEPTSLPTIAPIFQWNSDASLFDLFIYEVLPTDESANDVFSHEPYAIIRDLTTQNFQYPITPGVLTGNGTSEGSVRPLERGKHYAWYVEAKISTGVEGQFEKIKSQVYHFKINSFRSNQLDNEKIFIALQLLLGKSYDEIISQFKGYSPGDKILLNGKKITSEELIKLANMAQDGNLIIEDVYIY